MDQIENFARQKRELWNGVLRNGVPTISQAPWRKQLQIIGLFSLLLVFIALIAGIYLSVSARTAAVGREIQAMQTKIVEIDLQIEDLQSQDALLMSAGEMEKRAKALGFVPVQPEEIVYINVPDYIERRPAVLAPYGGQAVVSAQVIPPEYTESLFDWLARRLARNMGQWLFDQR